MALCQLHEPMVAQRHPMRVTRQVLQHLLRTAKRRLGVHHPLLGVQRTQPRRKRRSVAQQARQRQLALRVQRTQTRQELAAIHSAQHTHRQEESRTTRHPVRRRIRLATRVARQTAATHHAVHVRMQMQVLAPRVQHHQHANLGAQPLWIRCHLTQRLSLPTASAGCTTPTHSARGQLRQLRWQGEHQVVILHRQQIPRLTLQPARPATTPGTSDNADCGTSCTRSDRGRNPDNAARVRLATPSGNSPNHATPSSAAPTQMFAVFAQERRAPWLRITSATSTSGRAATTGSLILHRLVLQRQRQQVQHARHLLQLPRAQVQYVAVVDRLRWPRIFCNVTTSTPASIKCVAKLCRNVSAQCSFIAGANLLSASSVFQP